MAIVLAAFCLLSVEGQLEKQGGSFPLAAKKKKKMINVRNDFIFVANVIKNADQGIIF